MVHNTNARARYPFSVRCTFVHNFHAIVSCRATSSQSDRNHFIVFRVDFLFSFFISLENPSSGTKAHWFIGQHVRAHNDQSNGKEYFGFFIAMKAVIICIRILLSVFIAYVLCTQKRSRRVRKMHNEHFVIFRFSGESLWFKKKKM